VNPGSAVRQVVECGLNATTERAYAIADNE
jgi:hypothetical protein